MKEKTELEKLVTQYAENKAQYDKYKKLVDKDNSKIKSLMTELQLSEVEADGVKVVKVVQKRESMNEEGLIEYALTHLELSGTLKTKYYIDYDALESMIYNGDVPANIIADIRKFAKVKEVETLRVAKVKGA